MQRSYPLNWACLQCSYEHNRHYNRACYKCGEPRPQEQQVRKKPREYELEEGEERPQRSVTPMPPRTTTFTRPPYQQFQGSQTGSSIVLQEKMDDVSFRVQFGSDIRYKNEYKKRPEIQTDSDNVKIGDQCILGKRHLYIVDGTIEVSYEVSDLKLGNVPTLFVVYEGTYFHEADKY
jgi:hypothetical protein